MDRQESFLVRRGNEQFGPYTVEEASRYLASGNIVTTDLAWDEPTLTWVPITEMLAKRAAATPPLQPPRPRNPAKLLLMAIVWWFVLMVCFFFVAAFFAGVVFGFMNPKSPEEAGRIVGEIAALPIFFGSLALSIWLTVVGKLPGTQK